MNMLMLNRLALRKPHCGRRHGRAPNPSPRSRSLMPMMMMMVMVMRRRWRITPRPAHNALLPHPDGTRAAPVPIKRLDISLPQHHRPSLWPAGILSKKRRRAVYIVPDRRAVYIVPGPATLMLTLALHDPDVDGRAAGGAGWWCIIMFFKVCCSAVRHLFFFGAT
jgi:hypothetical protein